MKTLLTCLLISLLCLGNITPILAQNSEKLFQQGMMKEEGEGNLKAAIDIYNTIVNNVAADRMLRAKALLQVGICYGKLGDKNDRKTYQKLINEYSDQSVIVALGKEKLKGLKTEKPIANRDGIIATQVWSPAQDTYGVSPNGRYLNYIDWDNISLNLKDVKKGTTRVISKKGTWKTPMQFPDNSIWSPDGKQVAYYWFENNTTELRIVNVDGTRDRIIVTGNTKEETPWPVCWSPNGKYILSILTDETKELKNGNHQIALFSVNDGSLKILKSFEELQLGGQMDISPDNKYIVYAIQQMEGFQENDIYILSMDGKINKKIVGNSANDFNPRWTPDGKGILFISDRYGTNDLWKTKIENGIIPGASELVKANLGNQTKMLGITKDKSVFYEAANSRTDIYLFNIKTASAVLRNSLTKISKLNEIRNIDPTISKDGRYVAYFRRQLFRDDVLGYRLLFTVYDTKTEKSQNVETPLYNSRRHWYRPEWSPDGKKLLIFGLKSKNLLAGIFTFDIKTGETIAIKAEPNTTRHDLYSHTGSLHTFSNNGKSIYYLSNDKKSIHKIEIDSKRETIIYTNSKPLRIFKVSNDESKIVFGQFFDNRNNLYVVPTTGGVSKRVVSLNKGDLPQIIGWDSNNKHIYFGDGKFRDIKSIMKVSITGEDPKQVIKFKNVFPNGKITRVVLDHITGTIAIELEVGKGGEVLKLDGIFKD
jgi:Tol biopolymer transport system component